MHFSTFAVENLDIMSRFRASVLLISGISQMSENVQSHANQHSIFLNLIHVHQPLI
jgi:hypothetical protein